MKNVIANKISVIIPCYNQAHFLNSAIDSVLKQTYQNFEIVVIDDGSSDDTKQVAESYKNVKYIHQENKGLSAARNTGIEQSIGEFLVFLDADDWLYPDALSINIHYLMENKDIAFISGDYDYAKGAEIEIHKGFDNITSDHYLEFLQKNYVGMIATVLFRRFVFEDLKYDTTLKNCEDYDLYLKISRRYKVMHHLEKIAVYRLHDSNMSKSYSEMLFGALKVLKRQKKALSNTNEKIAYANGINFWKSYYSKELYKALRRKEINGNLDSLFTLLKFSPLQFSKYLIKSII